MRGIKKYILKIIIRLLPLIIILIIWEILARTLLINIKLAPAPSLILNSFIQKITDGDLFLDIIQSFFHYSIGISTAILIGIPIGIAIGYSKFLNNIFNPLIELIRPIPPIAWIPFAIMLFKLTPQAAGFVIFIGSIFPIILNTSQGVIFSEKWFLEVALTLGIKRKFQIIKKIVIPAALPNIMTGIRISLGIGWMCVVAAEMFGVSRHGVGYGIMLARWQYQPETLIAYMLTIGIIGLIIDKGFRLLEKELFPWK